MSLPLVSVIITTKNEQEVIERLLLSIKKSNYKNIEIIVVDNNSKDLTKKIAEKYTDKVFNFGPERSSQRNFGVKKSKGKYVLILDADMRLSRNVISECVNLAQKNKKIAQIIIPERSLARNFWERVKSFERYFYNKRGDELTDAARFFSKKVFIQAGGYDETITGPEDWDLTDNIKKLGYKTGRIKSAIYHFERISSPFKLAKKKFYYALKSHRYFEKQRIPVLSPKTIYFLRPVFYKNFKKLLENPILSLGMIFMLILELLFGAAGFVIGKVKNK